MNDRLIFESKMATVPYPTFVNQTPVDVDNGRAALCAVGKCRIFPETIPGSAVAFRAIVEKNIEQSVVDVDVDDKEQRKTNKQLRKKHMKEGVAMAKTYLMETLNLDVSVVDVEVYVDPKDLIETDGCLAACLLDAGCHAIVTDGSNLLALDTAKIPRERLVADFASPVVQSISLGVNFDTHASCIVDAASLASVICVAMSSCDDVSLESVTKIIQFDLERQKELNIQIIVQLNPGDCNSDDKEIASMIGAIMTACKDGHGTVTLVDPSASQLGLSYSACMKTDRADGLYTTVVCTRSGEALGLVYSSKVSIMFLEVTFSPSSLI
jgi:hypothetical protein